MKRIGSNNAADIAKADLPSRADCSAVVAAEVEIEPADNDGHGGEAAHGDEENRCVLEVRPVVNGQEDGESGDADRDWDHGEEEAVSGFVGDVGDDHGEAECYGPGGYRVQLCADRRVAVGSDDGGSEVGYAVRGYDLRRAGLRLALHRNVSAHLITVMGRLGGWDQFLPDQST